MNKVILMGRLTRDPEVRYTQTNNTLVASFSLAVNRRFARQGEERQADFINIVAWSKLGEFCSKYFKKGQQVGIIGRIQTRTWDENPAILIQNALSPAKVISVIADADEKSAKVVVPDYQLSLAIGKEGQNARLAARLTGFKIDIKSETQARESGDFIDYENDYEDDYEEEYSNEDEYPQKPETEEAYDEVSENEEINDTEVNEEADEYANTDDGDEE